MKLIIEIGKDGSKKSTRNLMICIEVHIQWLKKIRTKKYIINFIDKTKENMTLISTYTLALEGCGA